MTNKALKHNDWKQNVLGISLLVICFVLVGVLGWTIWKALSGLSKEVATAIIAGSATVLVSVISLILSKHWERRREIEQEHRKQKLPIYEEFMTFWFRVVMSHSPGKKPVSEEEMINFFTSFTQKLMIWGSDKVLKEYSNFKNLSSSIAEQPSSEVLLTMLTFEKLLFAIRSDVGHKNKGLGQGDLLALFITDLDKVLQVEN
ncbi:MAG: hypothetical protein IH975_06825 [Nitrospinae bacterium]|nr:hypothetical protein [Nitrospinota bacterium]